MTEKLTRKKIIKKLRADKKLTREESLFYLIEILQLSREEAEKIIDLNEARMENPNAILD